ncbi:hypothetical protein D9619_004746 [Psilocybe cf. subviscida]|uniref:Uncharacterized protein n=1 Tax=Psilocybe cf. subviscida TaxID=2480587 RepID=A0A8H5BNT9_9AGAR|nr:hypothetical protein D9619_004746 [Psilocybe cf. subviscida]
MHVPQRTLRRHCIQIVVMYIAFLVQALLIAFLEARNRFGNISHHSELLYTPAQDITSYQVKTFNFGIGDDLSPFQRPPSDELDDMWQELYNRDPNGSYIAEFDVFHQLHCLNMIRMALYPQRYPEMELGQSDAHEYINHCVDSIREYLMCAEDTNTIMWQWDDSQRNNTFRATSHILAVTSMPSGTLHENV